MLLQVFGRFWDYRLRFLQVRSSINYALCNTFKVKQRVLRFFGISLNLAGMAGSAVVRLEFTVWTSCRA